MTEYRLFKITYTDPETGERETVMKTFKDTPSVTALGWAHDWAYSASDKRMDYVIKELK